MKRVFLTGNLILALCLTACDNKDDNNNNSDTLNSMDQSFVPQASVSNNAEINAGQLAATKATNTSVKSFAQLMVTEHTTAQSDLRSRASAVGLTLSDTVDAEHRALMTRLNSLSGFAFDTAYMNSQVKDHLKTLTLFQTEMNAGNQSSIRNYANTYEPHIMMHLQRADSIRQTLH
jgi:putative membrane protein